MSIRGARRTMRVLLLVTSLIGGTHPYGGRSPRVSTGAKNALMEENGTPVPVHSQYNLTDVKYFYLHRLTHPHLVRIKYDPPLEPRLARMIHDW